MAQIFNSIEQLIGHTPLLRLRKTEQAYGLQAKLLAKLESGNPAGSVKDRVALKMVNDAELSGALKPDSVIIEPTSGNTGIGLALVAASRNYRLVIAMPENMSIERIRLMKALGAEVVLTPASQGMSGAIQKANELKNEFPNAFIPGQFDNPSNAEAHYETTGPEIYSDTDGAVDAFVAGIGTGGTITGTGRYLKEQNADIRIIGIEPKSSAVIATGVSGAHKIQGIGAGFIPKVLDTSVVDEVIPVSDEDAFATAKEIGPREGFLAGISSGAALFAAIEVAKRDEFKGKTVVVLLPDSGERYLSTPLYQ